MSAKPKYTLIYGYPFPRTADPLAIELAAIQALTEPAHKGTWSFRGRKCGNGLPFHVKAAMKLLWPEMEWHRWSNLMVDEFLKSPGRTACYGPSSCVAGETQLVDAITGKSHSIKFLCENRIRPFVMTLNGPRQASIPFLKGISDLYEVTTSRGSKFTCTLDHRLMISPWKYETLRNLSVGSRLLRYEPSHHQTNSDIDQLIHASNEDHCLRTIPDSQFDYHFYSHSDGEPLHYEADIDRYGAPSLSDAQEYKVCVSFDSDDSGNRSERIRHHQHVGRLATAQISRPFEISKTSDGLHFVQEIPEFESFLIQQHFLYPPEIHSDRQPFSGSYRDCARTCYPDDESPYSSHAFDELPYRNKLMVRYDAVASIRWAGAQKYYDLHVPYENHYFAEGAIHHNSGKSFVFSRAALTMFYARPKGTTVLISSTTLDALKRRIWGYVVSSDKEARQRYPHLAGSLIESKTMMLADPSTEENRSHVDGIIGVACRVGGEWRGLEAFVGVKNDIVLLVCDELQFVSQGVMDSLANLESNDMCYAALMGNLPNINNPLATAAEPKMGWSSLPYTNKTRVYETKWRNGRAIQLIAVDSPNLEHPEGKEPFPKLIGRRYINQMAENYGRGTPKFAMFADGNIPTSDMTCTVLTKDECKRRRAGEKVIWGKNKLIRGYGMDAAYSGLGGDRTVGVPFVFGLDSEDKFRFWAGPMKLYGGSPDSSMSHAEAIALEVKLECEAMGIPPNHFFFDGTGRSELTSALARLWSPSVVPIEFGGMATERAAFTGERHLDGEDAGNRKTCREVFDKFVSELWFAIRWCVTSDQMRGMSDDCIEECSRRQWEIVRGNKYSVEPKSEMKERGLRSPDLADALAASLEGARRLGFPLGNIDGEESKVRPSKLFREWKEKEWSRANEDQLTTV